MSNIFSMQRFLWLFNKHTKEHYKTYLMSVAVLIGVLFIGMAWAAKNSDGLFFEGQVVIFYFFLLFSGTIFTSSMFSDLGDKKKAAITLTLPVSNLERFLVLWLYSLVIFQLVFVICFYGIGAIFFEINGPDDHHKLLNIWAETPGAYNAFFMFCVLHAISFLGAVSFRKLHFIKTALVLFVFLYLLYLISQPMVKVLLNLSDAVSNPFNSITIFELNENNAKIPVSIDDPESLTVIKSVLMLFTTLILWVAAYFKLKEKQI